MVWFLWLLLKATGFFSLCLLLGCVLHEVLSSKQKMPAGETGLGLVSVFGATILWGSGLLVHHLWVKPSANDPLKNKKATPSVRDAGHTLLARLQKADSALIATRDRVTVQLTSFEELSWNDEDGSPDQFLKECRTLVAELLSLGKLALNNNRELIAQAKDYDELAAHAPQELRSLAAGLRKAAQAESFKDIQQDYHNAAQVLDAFAAHYEERLAAIRPAIADLQAMIPYVEATVRFLEGFHLALSQIKDIPTEETSEQLIAQLRQYVTRFDKLRASLRSFSDRLESPASAGKSSVKGETA